MDFPQLFPIFPHASRLSIPVLTYAPTRYAPPKGSSMPLKASPLLALLLLGACLSLNATGTEKMKATPSMQITHMQCEGLTNPLGVDLISPRLSWILESDRKGQSQTAYQILVAGSPDLLAKDESDRWNTGKVPSGQSINICYGGAALESGKAYFWKVRVWDKKGKPSDWSPVGTWSMGILNQGEWKGKWIGHDEIDKTYYLTNAAWIWFPEGDETLKFPFCTRYFRCTFDVSAGRNIKNAILHVTADDSAEFYLNGNLISSTKTHTKLSETEVGNLLRDGRNLIAVVARNADVGIGLNPAGVVGALEVQFSDGSSMRVSTDSTWKSIETAAAGWETLVYDDSQWKPVRVLGQVGMKPWGPKHGREDRLLPARWLRKEFILEKQVKRATVYMSGLGLSELYINGSKIGDHVLSPALSEYPKRVFYVTHDVTHSLDTGANALGVILGNGRYFAPRRLEPTPTQTYGYPKLLLQLHIEYSDGTVSDVVSDESWRLTTDGPITANNEYDGEEYDATREFGPWSEPGFNDGRWQTPEVVAAPGGALRAQMINPIRVVATITPVKVSELRPGVFVYDMGQNLVGWCRLHANGPGGTRISLRHAETLRSDGGLFLDNIRTAKANDIFTLKGGGEEVYEPRFTYHGFRYVELTGYPGRPDLSTLVGCVVNDDVKPAGEFSTSHPVINAVYKNIVWGVQGNYRSIPTDCPQRDERQGWLGDRSAESRGETFLFDVSRLYAKWVQDIADGQAENGSVSDVCPTYWPLFNDNVTWPSSTVIIPNALFEQYADTALIRDHYQSMVKWIDHMRGYIKEGVLEKDTYGDWCVPPENLELILTQDPLRKTAGGILSTTYFFYDLQLMARYATIIGKKSEAERFSTLARELKDGLNRRYYNDALGYYDNGSQTSCVLPLAFGMVPENARAKVFGHLIHKITEETNSHIGTGLVGGQWLSRVLADNGRADLAYTFATNTTYPSWGYMVEKGATTIWELWNGDKADPSMNSGNHVMLVGDLVIWFYEYLAGIKSDPNEPGFKHIVMRPTPVGDLHAVRATHNSPYGLIESSWQRNAQKFTWDVRVPVNSTATVYVPARKAGDVTEGGRPIRSAPGVKFIKMEGSSAQMEIESGVFHFQSTLPQEISVKTR
jgi:alpha-L-rhamnosidase